MSRPTASRRHTPSRRPRQSKRRLRLEDLERRRLLTTYLVDSLADDVAAAATSDGSLTLREAITAANSNAAFGDAAAGSDTARDVIRFDSSLAGGTIMLDDLELSITDTLSILGGGVTIDADRDSRIFNIDDAGNVFLGDMTITGGNAVDGGGILSTDSTLTLRDVIVADNRVPVGNGGGSGGGLFITGGSAAIFNSTFESNTAERAGGAIEIADGANVRAIRSSFDFNEAVGGDSGPGNGGAIHISGDASFASRGSTFQSNIAAAEGGGVWNSAVGRMVLTSIGSDRTVISGNVAQGNDADTGGGGVYNDGGTLSIAATDIVGNFAEGTSGSGGGILTVGGDVTVARSTITGNEANRAGGGVEIVDGTLQLSDVTLDFNTAGPLGSAAPGNGGGLHVSGVAEIAVIRGTVNNNLAALEGGGLWNQAGSVMFVDGTTINGNIASGDDADTGGGGVFNNGGDMVIANSTINGNLADGSSGSGGGLLSVDGDVVITDTTFDDNTAARAGGAIEVIDGTFRVTGSTLSNNDAGVDVTAAPGNGGAVHISGVTAFSIVDSLVTGNVAALEGGGLWNQAGSTMLVDGTVVTGNTALGDDADTGGGGLFNNGGDMTVVGSEIDNNSATGTSGSGGGILSTDGSLVVVRSSVDGNTASRAGGGVEIIEGGFRMTASSLSGNATGPMPGNGGGLHVTGAADSLIVSSQVMSNTAAAEGGGLWNSAGGTMTVDRGTIIMNNTASGDAADQGGGGVFNDGGTLTIANSTINANFADGTSGSGGGLLSVDGDVLVRGTTMQGNEANRAGGAIEVIDGRLRVNGSLLSGNVAGPDGTAAPGNGGAIHVTGMNGTFTLVRSTSVTGNIAGNEGGGLWNQSGSTMSVLNSIVSENLAQSGGGIGGGVFENGGVTTIRGSIISNNDAANAGGGVYVTENASVVMRRTNVTDNTTDGLGGGVFNAGDVDAFFGSIADNDADATAGSGGGLYADTGSVADLNDVDLMGNTPDDSAGPGTVNVS